MKTKFVFFILLIPAMIFASSCHREKPKENSPEKTEISTDGELFEEVLSRWKSHETDRLYEYADDSMRRLLSKDDFVSMFEKISKIGGEMNGVSDRKITDSEGVQTYTAAVDFENITVDVTVSIRDLKINSFFTNLHMKNSFEITENGITQRFFVLENGKYRLNAVYTYVNDEKAHPAVLLIAGSGPSDYNETVGLLTPFEDMAVGLAKRGICSLRMDKRTLNYASGLGEKAGIEEEYLQDCRAAVRYLQEQNISKLFVVGHSLGGQIATELAAGDQGIDGMILFNSTARHLADVMCDQFEKADPANKMQYVHLADEAKKAEVPSAKGLLYFGANDYYWAAYNRMDVIKNIANAKIATLILNSRLDRQLFTEDLELWNRNFSNSPDVSLQILEDINHFGYKNDAADPDSFYRAADFPEEVLDLFSEFIRKDE